MELLNFIWNKILLIVDYLVDKSFVQTIVFSFLTFVFGFIRGTNNWFFILPILRNIKALLFKRKYILVWNDHSPETSEKLIKHLKSKSPKFNYRVIKTGEKLMSYPINKNSIHMVILIVTDVTKLSEVEKRRILIQKKLIKYVKSGGVLFGTHDIIYRRCRNNLLQEAYGCEICSFQRVHKEVPVHIIPEHKTHPLLTGLPDNFKLDDNEVCWGDWNSSAKILIETDQKFRNVNGKIENAPTLVVNHIGNSGTLIWFNSADKISDLPASLQKPQKEVVKIITNAIDLIDEIKLNYIQEINT